jgi:hypothetical protein
MTFWDFKKLPFLCIKITYKCMLLNNFIPHYQEIHEERKCLPLSVDLDIRTFLAADKDDPASLQEFFEIATLDCLIHIGKRYQLKIKVFQDRHKRLGKVPKWDLKMKGNSSFFSERKLKSISLSKNLPVTKPGILLEKRKII